MRKKHFEALAAALLHARPGIDVPVMRAQWQLDVEQIALACATTNPHFDKARFYAAAGVKER